MLDRVKVRARVYEFLGPKAMIAHPETLVGKTIVSTIRRSEDGEEAITATATVVSCIHNREETILLIEMQHAVKWCRGHGDALERYMFAVREGNLTFLPEKGEAYPATLETIL